jgi:prepilin-type N-terminal cleavage/methylation domain-containing protein
MRAFIKNIMPIKKSQNGFSLIELLAAIAISSIVILGLVITIFQLFVGHARSSGEMNIVRQVQQAGFYISRDTQMAKEVITGDIGTTADLEVVTLTWYWFEYHAEWEPPLPADRDGAGLRVIYTLEGNKLYRNYDVFYEDDVFNGPEDPTYGEVTFGELPYDYKTLVAEYIEEINCDYDGITLTLTITASVDSIAGEQVETRIYEAKRRPNVF